MCIKGSGDEEEAYKTKNDEMISVLYIRELYKRESGVGGGWTVRGEMWAQCLKSSGVWVEERGWDSNTNNGLKSNSLFTSNLKGFSAFVIFEKHLHVQQNISSIIISGCDW